ncbi:MAG TPA: cell division protein FtsA [Alphaproteobacteria bacterium]|nr:cell division protein FtsA [Alphaproteobacteria bacterium]
MRTKPRGELIATLDVGTTKVVCFIARVEDDGEPKVIGIGHQVSRGVRTGTIVDMDAAEAAIGHAVNSAEQMAGEQIRDVVVNLAGGHPASQIVGVEMAIAGHDVGDVDLKRALRAHHHAAVPPDREVIHAVPVGYAIDGARGIRDPRGMFGDRLAVEIHLVTANAGAVRNLSTCVSRCHLETEGFVISPYSAGLACLVEDEMELGCTVIDMGGGTTSIAVFFEGRMVFADCIPVGGHHVTNDIARGLTTPVVHAERMKVLYGSAIPNVSDEREIIDVPQVGEEEPTQANHVPRSLLTGIIQPRMEEMFELVRSRLEASGFDKVAGRRVVLTGGGSQLQGVRELAQLILDKQVRMGRPLAINGLAESTCGPAFSTAAGLLAYAVRNQGDLVLGGTAEDEPQGGLWSRLGGWLRDNL